MDPSRLGARAAAGLIADGELTVVQLVKACLARIAAREPQLHAWIHLDPEQALAQAREYDARGPRPPLYGVPIGVKDIIDTADMPTAYGSPIYRGHRPATDADCVARVRSAGGVILGKTVTTEFAYRHPFGETRNPHHPGHSPGGSSSGSAAAVADFMVPLAFGTQTGGSIIRPASYCGVYGYKPSFDTFSLGGVKPLASSLDTLGHFARNIDDLAFLGSVLSPRIPAELEEWPDTPRIGIARMAQWSQAEPATVEALDGAVRRLQAAGAVVEEASASAAFAALPEAHQVIMNVEALRALATERSHHQTLLSDELAAILDRAAKIPAERYEQALATAHTARAQLETLFARHDVLLTASAPGEAPAGLGFTGDPVFNRVWTLLHVPCVSIPAARGPKGLPVGVQLVGRPGKDQRLLAAAKWVAAHLDA